MTKIRLSNGPLSSSTAKRVTWQLPEGRDLKTWWKPENANTSAVTSVAVQFKDEANIDNNQQGQCYQNVYGVFPGDSSQYPSVVNSGKRNIDYLLRILQYYPQ